MMKKTDRRIQRTRQLLQDALMSMMIEKGYEATTVQHIIDRANVGRATFYAHFADKETLLTSRLEDLRSFLAARQKQAPATLAFSLAMLEHAHSHLAVWTAIVGRNAGTYVAQRIQRIIADLSATDLRALAFKGSPAERNLAAEFIAGAFMAVLIWWLDQGAKTRPEDVDTILRRLVMQGLSGEWGLRTIPKAQAPSPGPRP